jgi:hypothetical protein
MSVLEAIGRAYAYGLLATFGLGLAFAIFAYVPIALRLLLRAH